LASMALPSGLLAGLLNRLCRWSAGTWMIRPQCSARGAALIRLIRSSSGWRAVLRWRSPSASILVLICFAAARCWLRLPQLRGWCTAACRRPSMSLREGQRLHACCTQSATGLAPVVAGRWQRATWQQQGSSFSCHSHASASLPRAALQHVPRGQNVEQPDACQGTCFFWPLRR